MSKRQAEGRAGHHLPSEANNELNNDKKTASRPNQPTTLTANPIDIICGRGFHIVNHRGNLNLHLMVNTYREEYLKSKRSDKRKITNHVLDEIKSTGARFIRRVVADGQSADEWVEVDDETAFKKVSHALRLRTKNESNRDTGPMAAASPVHRKAGASIIEEQTPRNLRGSTVPVALDSSVVNGDSDGSGSRKKPPCSSTGQAVSSTQPIAGLGIQAPLSALGSRFEQPAGHLSYSTGLSPFVPSAFLSNDQRLQYEANHQAYWNIMSAFLQQSRR